MISNQKKKLFPLASPQLDIWFDQMLLPENPQYNVGSYTHIEGAINPILFESAVQYLVNHHDALRMQVVLENDAFPQQIFVDKVEIKLPIHDFSQAPDPQQAALTWMEDQVVQPFPLEGHRLFRLALLRLGETDFQFFCVGHHLIVDRWSLALMSTRLGEIYTALEQGKTPDLVAPAYQDFVQDDQRYRESSRYTAHRNYWLEKYAHLPEPLLVARHPTPSGLSMAPSDRQVMTLNRLFYNRLKDLAKRCDVSTFHLILGALYVYLTRTLHIEEVVMGLPILNRPGTTFKNTVGLFVSVSAARFDFGTDLNFQTLLQRIGRELKKNYRNQRLPISELNRELGLHKSGRTRLYDISVSYEKQDFDVSFDSFQSRTKALLNRYKPSPLTIHVREFHAEHDVDIDFIHNLAYFDPIEIELMQSRLQLILEHVLDHSEAPINSISLLTKSEQQQLIAWNQTQTDFPKDQTLAQLFEQQVASIPHKIAVQYGSEQLSYEELNAQANQLAHHLISLGVEADTLVGICAERSLEMVIGALGILKAGGAYVPLDPNYPAERLKIMLQDSGANIVICQRHLQERLSIAQELAASFTIVCWDHPERLFTHYPTQNPSPRSEAHHLAHVLYTSGSTGRPKGVCIPQSAVVRLVKNTNYIELTPEDSLSQTSNTSFDASTFEIWGSLLNGARLVGIPKEVVLAPHKLAQYLKDYQINTVFLTTALLHQIAQEQPDCFRTVKTVMTGGEKLAPQWAAAILNNNPPEQLLNAYGPTENTTYATWHRVCLEDTQGPFKTIPIGRPIANTQIHILDDQYQPQPIGVPGELCIGGEGLARGYLHRPELTAEKFIECEVLGNTASGQKQRLYRTGDLARWLPNGTIEFLGRRDHQVKLSGFRIELGEIETTLCQHESVKDAVVMLYPENPPRLITYFTLVGTLDEGVGSLRIWLKDRLPGYMIPASFTVLEHIPLTPNGKVDHAALPEPLFVENSEGQTAPRTPVEELLLGIWSQLLPASSLGVHTNFFDVGGQSLLAAQVLSRIREAFQVEITLPTLFEMPTVAQLAKVVESQRQLVPRLPLKPFARTSEGSEPLSFAQQRLWFLDRLHGGGTYNIPMVLELWGPLDINKLFQSINAVVQRQESLRTNFTTVDGMPQQVIHAERHLSLPFVDLREEPESTHAAAVKYWANCEAEGAFDLQQDSLLRLRLLRLSDAVPRHCSADVPGEPRSVESRSVESRSVESRSVEPRSVEPRYVLLLTLHHIIADGWSLGVLLQEWSALYQSQSLPELPIQYADYARWQREWFSGERLASELDYWKQQLHGIPTLLNLPTDHPRPTRQTFHGASISVEIATELTEALHRLSRENGATLFMTLLSAYMLVLSRYSGQDDIVVGTPAANRSQQELEPLIGFFVNTLPLRGRLSPDLPFRDFLRQIRKIALEAYAHQDLPFEQLVDELNPERSLSHSPLFQAMLALHNAPSEILTLPGITGRSVEMEMTTTKFDMTLFLSEQEGRLVGRLNYNCDVFEAGTMQRLMQHFQNLLQACVKQPEGRLSELPMLTDAETHTLLTQWSRPHGDEPILSRTPTANLIELFEHQVEQTPHHTALVFEQESLTYRELNDHANRLAHRLIREGVRPAALVGLCMERSLEMVVSIIAILKAGGTYVPLDPTIPEERLAFILEDTHMSVLVIQPPFRQKQPFLQQAAEVILVPYTLEQEYETTHTSNLKLSIPTHQAAYIIYTSGTTGHPKGVIVSHHNVIRLFTATEHWFHFNSQDVWTLFHSYAFDVSVWEIWGALLHGGKLVVVPYLVTRSPDQFRKLLAREHVTVLSQTPSAFLPLIAVETSLKNHNSSTQPPEPLNLRFVVFAGEALNLESLRPWMNQYGDEAPQLINMYGITETTVHSTFYRVTHDSLNQPGSLIGVPIPDLEVYILDAHQQPVPVGVPGELYVGGAGVTQGYLNRPELTNARFLPHPFDPSSTARVYKSGDLVRFLPDGAGAMEYLGRIDTQVQLRGFRIELGEIENQLLRHDAVKEAVVLAHQDTSGAVATVRELVAYVVTTKAIDVKALRHHLQNNLPEYMIPAYFVRLDQLPLNHNGKVDRRVLASLQTFETVGNYQAPETELEAELVTIWSPFLKVTPLSTRANFFEVGGNSLTLVQVHAEIDKRYPNLVSLPDLFAKATIADLAHFIEQRSTSPKLRRTAQIPSEETNVTPSDSQDIAIIGMGLHLADYDDLESFWQDLVTANDRVGPLPEGRKHDADALLQWQGIDPQTVQYREMAYLHEIDGFDYRFFRLSPRDSELMDPNQRLFLQTAWKTLEHAGYSGSQLKGERVGVFLGMGAVRDYAQVATQVDPNHREQIFASNVPSNIASRLSYLLDWHGPVYMTDTACSSSLTALHLACKAIHNDECRIALVGTVKTTLLPVRGPAMEIEASDARTHAFDDDSDGTGSGEGVIAVMLKPLQQAVQDHDTIHAVIKGSAVNHDGSSAGMTVPNADAQADLVEQAWKQSGVDPQTIRFIEAHGTGTKIGDPIEIDGLSKAFARYTHETQFCAVGSVKTNFGHLDNAAGLLGLVKSVLCLQHKTVPPLLHFQKPNHKIPFVQSAVYPAAKIVDLNSIKGPIRCGVSSFGLSGINCHVVLEDASSLPQPANATRVFRTFENKRCWLKLPSVQRHPISMPSHQLTPSVFVQECRTELPDQTVYALRLHSQDEWVLREHKVMGQETLVGTAYFQLLFEVARKQGISEGVRIRNLMWRSPMQLQTICAEDAQPLIRVETKKQEYTVTVLQKLPDATWQHFGTAILKSEKPIETEIRDVAAIIQRCESQPLPELGRNSIVSVSNRWHCLKQVWKNEKEILGHLHLETSFQADLERFAYHPPLLDVAVSLGLEASGFLPMACARISLFRTLPTEIYSHVQKRPSTSPEILQCDITLMDCEGSVVALLEGFAFKRVQPPYRLYGLQWVQQVIQLNSSTDVPKASEQNVMVIGHHDALAHWPQVSFPESSAVASAWVRKTQNFVFVPSEMAEPTLNLLRLVQWWVKEKVKDRLNLLILGHHTFSITGNESQLHPEYATLAGMAKVITREHSNLQCCFVDTDSSTTPEQILEVWAERANHPIALRNGAYYVETTGDLDLQNRAASFPVRSGGVYLITGGLGGIGLAIAQHLSQQHAVKLALVGRTPLPPRDTWDSIVKTSLSNDDAQQRPRLKLCQQIQAIQALEASGSEWMMLTADVSQIQAMEAALRKIHEIWGSVNGIFHCAGVAGDGFLFKKQESTFQQVLAPKVKGTQIVDQLTRSDRPDFMVLCSSLTGLVGAAGQSDYTAANAFLDAYAAARQQAGFRTLSINWPAWQETGMAFDWGVVDRQPTLHTRDALDALQQLGAYFGTQALVLVPPQTPDILPLARVSEAPLQKAGLSSDALATPKTISGEGWPSPNEEPAVSDIEIKGRDDSAYTEMEIVLARIWCEILGYDEIDIDEGFYDLGGDSMNALEISNAIAENLQLDVSIDELFTYPSIRKYVAHLETSNIHANAKDHQPIQRLAPQQDYPVSAAQRRIYILWEMAKDSTGFNLPKVMYVQGHLELPRLEQAFHQLIARHSSLRTSFAMNQDQLVQIVAEEAPFTLRHKQLEQEALAGHIQQFSRPFDLSQAPLFRAEVVTVASGPTVLMYDVHHSVSDAMSVNILSKELVSLYQQESLPELPFTYADFAVWQHEQLVSEKAEEDRAYWLQQLSGNLPVLDLPLDFSRPPVMTHAGDVVRFEVDTDLLNQVRHYASNQETTPFVIFLAAFYILLHRYSRQDDIIIAVADSGRAAPGLEQLVGMFINTLPLRAYPQSQKRLSTFLEETKSLFLQGYAHRSYPFDQLVRELDLPRDLSRNPITDISFSYMNFEQAEIDQPGLTFQPYLDKVKDSTKLDCSIFATEMKDRVHFALEYYSSIFSHQTMQTLGERWLTLVQQMVSGDDPTLAEISLFLPQESEQLRHAFNASASPYPRDLNLAVLYEQQCEARPDKMAVVTPSVELTYRALNHRANYLGCRLQNDYGVQPGDRVMILMQPSEWWLATLLGILKIGAVCVPIHAQFPKDRVQFIAGDTQARVIVTDAAHWSEVEQNYPNLATLVTGLNGYREDTDYSYRPGETQGQDPAFILYTSGSTGVPKGVLLSHRTASRTAFNTYLVTLHETDRMLQTTAISFDVSTYEVWGTLLNGATLYIPEDRALLDAKILKRWISQHQITCMFLTTTFFHQHVDAAVDTFQGLRFLLVGGEKMLTAAANRFYQALPHTQLINIYGPTENMVAVTFFPVESEVIGEVPLGKPISNTKVYVLDEQQKLLPPGFVGEICSGGDGLADGYWNRPDLTKERFIEDPFQPGTQLYRTGDLGRIRVDGFLEFWGRKDNQIKLRGNRIELDEVESVMMAHPTVELAAVKLHPQGHELVGYYTHVEGLEIEDFRQFLRSKLPEFMVPGTLMPLDVMPRTATGKIDRQHLPEADLPQRDTQKTFRPPRTPVEKMVAEVWAEILRVPDVSINDNFFDLGGHSLMATQVISRLNGLLNLDLSVRTLFLCPVLADLCENITTTPAPDGGNPTVEPLHRLAERPDPLPLSFAQERLWFLDRLVPDNPFYNMVSSMMLRGPLRVEGLQQSVQIIVDRHESLRTRFIDQQGVPQQVIAPILSIACPLTDLQNLEPSKRRPTAKAHLLQEAQYSFDLAKGPLIRMSLVRFSESEHLFVMVLHHIISDGWSMGRLFQELSTIYSALSQEEKPKLPQLPVQYADFAIWQRRYLAGAELDRQLAYWQHQLADVPILQLPTDRPRPAVQSYRGGVESFEVSAECLQQLRQITQQAGGSLYMTLLAVFAVLLSRYSNQDEIVIGSPIANRNRREIESLIGFFVNNLVFRLNLAGNPSFESFLTQVRDCALEAFHHQDIPFEKIVEVLQPERDMSRTPITQVSMALQNAPLSPLDFPDLEVTGFPLAHCTVRFDLELEFWEMKENAPKAPNGLLGHLRYSVDLFDATTIRRMVGHLQNLLQAVAAQLQKPVGQLPLLSEAERIQMILDWNQHTRTDPRGTCLHHLWEAQVDSTPHNIAVVYEVEGASPSQHLTYRDLNIHANRLAHQLIQHGVGPDHLVALCVEQPQDIIVCLLGVLKAGGAYVPLDPKAPEARLRLMLEEIAPTVLITQKALLSQLPTDGPSVLYLDGDSKEGESVFDHNPQVVVADHHLAYVLYTSGSTGRPKGVMIEHRAIVDLMRNELSAMSWTTEDRLLQKTTYTFDMAVVEFFPPLLCGAQLIAFDPNQRQDVTALLQAIQKYEVTVVQLVPTLLDHIVTHHGLSACRSLKRIICGGEALPQTVVAQATAQLPVTIYNLYGPTESTVYAAGQQCDPLSVEAAASAGNVPIGRPIANAQVYLLDAYLQPVPVGVVGEIYLGGTGVARGYLHQPELTAERFIESPFSQGQRLYKTGDLGRYLPHADASKIDGTMEFMGRADQQLKIRGFRVEPGEIEAVLAQHEAAQETLVVPSGSRAESKQLVAYVVPNLQALQETGTTQAAIAQAEHVAHWQSIYDQSSETESGNESKSKAQTREHIADLSFNIQGWNDSYTHAPIPAEEMREWVEQTVFQIQSLNPQRLLEIGCGMGLLLSRLAPQCAQYWGTDFSARAIDYSTRLKQSRPDLQSVRLFQLGADEFHPLHEALSGESNFDTIVLNSVIQYFPDVHYLLTVLKGAFQLLSPGGSLFLGDIRNRDLLWAFHASVQLHQAAPASTLSELKLAIQENVRHEEELLISPDFFHALRDLFPQITRVHIHPKLGRYQNELSRYRYDVVISTESSSKLESSESSKLESSESSKLESLKPESLKPESLKPESLKPESLKPESLMTEASVIEASFIETPLAKRHEWKEGIAVKNATLGEVREWLQGALSPQTSRRGLGLRTVSNARLQADRHLLELLEQSEDIQTVGQFRQILAERPQTGLEPTDLQILAEEMNCSVEFRLLAQGDYEVRFSVISESETTRPIPETTPKPWETYTNHPLQAKRLRQLIPQFREFLSARLPEYMMPSAFMLLDAIPWLPNGKVNRKALPDPHNVGWRSATEYVAPRDAVEETLVEIWQSVLGIDRLGIRDNFFHSGGQSLLAVSLISKVNKTFQQNLPLASLFQSPTIETLAQLLENASETSQEWSPLVPFRQTGTRPPIFCFYPAGGNIYAYRELSDHLGDDQPFYAMQALGLEPGQMPLETVEAMASYYIPWMQSVQAEGPYFVCGWSFGGAVAYEVAQQLQAKNLEVGWVGLLDSSAKPSNELMGLYRSDNATFWAGLFAEFLTLSVDYLRSLSDEEQLRHVMEQAKTAGIIPNDFDIEQTRALFRVYKNNAQAFYRYQVRSYPGTVTLIRPRELSRSAFQYTQSPTQGWDQFVLGGVDVQWVSGKHESMLFSPHVKTLAKTVQQCLAKIGQS